MIEEAVKQIEFWFNLSLSDVTYEGNECRALVQGEEKECQRLKDIIFESDGQVLRIKSEMCENLLKFSIESAEQPLVTLISS